MFNNTLSLEIKIFHFGRTCVKFASKIAIKSQAHFLNVSEFQLAVSCLHQKYSKIFRTAIIICAKNTLENLSKLLMVRAITYTAVAFVRIPFCNKMLVFSTTQSILVSPL